MIGRRGWILIFQRESRLAADKEIWILMLAVKSEGGVSEVVYSVVTENKRLLVLGEITVAFFSFVRRWFLFG